ncbi:MAG: hypothetical protein J6U92_01355 [Clostridia bacterium]|nr:hypothetical protein [Clostridia bacterium]
MKTYKKYKIVIAIILFLITVLSSIFMADIITTEEGLGKAVGFVLWLVFASPCFLAVLILSLIGVILAIVNKKKGLSENKTLLYFVIFTILPIVIYFATVGSFYIFVN